MTGTSRLVRLALWPALGLALLGAGCATAPNNQDGAAFRGPYLGVSGGAGQARP